MADVFISYKREELARAAQVAQALSEEGFSAFYDLHEDGIHAGEQWDKRLEAELEAARCCVVLWSAASVASDNVRSEARRAHNRGILVPAKIGACTPPIGLDSLQEADLRAWRGDRSDPHWRYLVDRGVARKLGRPGRPPAVAVPATGGGVAAPPQSAHESAKLPPWAIGAAIAALALVAVLIWPPWRGERGAGERPELQVSGPQAAEPSEAPLSGPPASAPSAGSAPPQATQEINAELARVRAERLRGAAAGALPEMVRIPGRNFEVGRYEVTFAQWDACVADGGCNGYRPNDNGWGRGARPVINVSWNDAQAYVQWLSRRTGQRYRLLTEAEWEYAARAGTTTHFSWGNQDPVCDQSARNGANFSACTDNRTRPVGSFQPNGFGLYDMHGNVLEWVEDCYDSSCSSRVLRGGSWYIAPRYLRSANRYGLNPSDRSSSFGFRLARTV